eukprot:c5012_g1_i1.p1 GENE.c5012_g1_i1~~c5012_g1_i1.p1  ORF type:complete len:161 (-),score=26.51 c5012_g1_i1:37-468(-)
MSSDLVWLIVRNNSSFLVKRNGAQLTSEPNNLTGRNTFKFSGLANKKALGITATDKGLVLTKKSTKGSNARKPASALVSQTLKRDIKRVARSIKNATQSYRPDLEKAALARATALFRARRSKATGVKVQLSKRARSKSKKSTA